MKVIAYIKSCGSCEKNCNIYDEQEYFGEAKAKVLASVIAYMLDAEVYKTMDDFGRALRENNIQFREAYIFSGEENVELILQYTNPTILAIDDDNMVFRIDIKRSVLIGKLAELDTKLNDFIFHIGVTRILTMEYEEIVKLLYEERRE